jgi:hypothetical protein
MASSYAGDGGNGTTERTLRREGRAA